MNNMKYKILTLLVFSISFGTFAQDVKIGKNPIKKEKLTSAKDTMQYTIGAYLGQWMVKNNFQVQNANLFLTGMEDVLKQRELAISDSLIARLIANYQQATQIEKSKLLEQQLFASIKGKAGIGVLPNGVHYIVRRQGEGLRPRLNNKVEINAVGVLPDGTIIEDSYKKKQSITTDISTLIPGLKEAIQLMPVGSVYRIFIPAELGYGAAGLKNLVPPHSALVYDIELLGIKE